MKARPAIDSLPMPQRGIEASGTGSGAHATGSGTGRGSGAHATGSGAGNGGGTHAAGGGDESAADRRIVVHPPAVQVSHWLNVIAIFIMVGSGWHIYDNVPIFSWLYFPKWATLGGDPDITYRLHGDVGFGNALLWHFGAMWLLVLNGLFFVGYGLISGRFRRRWLPISAREVVSDVRDALTFRLQHEDISVYNAVQKLMYVGVLCVLGLAVLSGLAVWKPVQFQEVTALLGGFQGARLVHFLCMAAIVLFVLVHVTLALLVPQTLVAMFTGRARVPAVHPE